MNENTAIIVALSIGVVAFAGVLFGSRFGFWGALAAGATAFIIVFFVCTDPIGSGKFLVALVKGIVNGIIKIIEFFKGVNVQT